jgi:hypothetical protein
VFRELTKTFRALWSEPGGRRLVLGFLTIVGTGTVFYHFVEGWSYVNALYFTVVMLTTIGFGDFHPTTEFSRIFTVLFILIGVSFILGFLNFIMTQTMQRRVEEGRLPENPLAAPGYTPPATTEAVEELEAGGSTD